MREERDKGDLSETPETQRKLGVLSDEALLALVRDGDERAFETLVVRYRKPLRNYCVRLGIAVDAADDVIQQVMLEAWLALRKGAQVHSYKAWLFRIAHNVSLDTIAAAPRVAELNSGAAELAAGTHPAMLEPGLKETLTAVAELPLLQREAIVRTALAGESYEQVGRYLGLTAGAVRGLIHRGRATLRSALAALVPPWLTRLIASRSSAGAGARESLLGLAYSASSGGSAGALVKAGVIAVVAATAITTAIPGHAARSRSGRHRATAPIGQRGTRTHAEAGLDRGAAASRSASPDGGRKPRAGASRNGSRSLRAFEVVPANSGTRTGSGGSRDDASSTQTGTAVASQPGAVHQSGAATTIGPASGPTASTATTATSTTAAAGASSSQTSASAGGEPGSGSSSTGATAGAGTAGSGSAEQSGATSGSSGSSSNGSGGLVGELVHTVEKTLETTIESTLGGLLRH